MEKQIKQAYEYGSQWLGQGAKANYIPELEKMDENLFSVCVVTTDDRSFQMGDAEARFTIQSISKVISLATALEDVGASEVFARVGMEPTGDPFNSIIRLEGEFAKPLNPFINAGAIAVMSCVKGDSSEEKFQHVLEQARKLLGSDCVTYSEEVYQSEKATGDKNRALAYMMKTNKVFEDDVEDLLDAYFKVCSIEVSCGEVARLGGVLANKGICPKTEEILIQPVIVKQIVSLMSTCGMYDASGEYALKVGIPSKSGVGGGILACVPGKMGIATFSPALDEKGNSVCGMKVLEHLSEALGLSIYEGLFPEPILVKPAVSTKRRAKIISFPGTRQYTPVYRKGKRVSGSNCILT